MDNQNGFDNEVQTMENQDWEGEMSTHSDDAAEPVMQLDPLSPEELVFTACMVASKMGCEVGTLDAGQAGPCEFSLRMVTQICYRLDAPITDAEIALGVQKLKRTGAIDGGSKRGHYVMGTLYQMPHDVLMAELRATREARNRPNSK